MVTDVGDQTFEQDVIARSAERPVVVDFWAPWCGPCRTLGPVLEQAVDAHAGEVELVKVNTDEHPRLAARFAVRGIPAVKAFRDGQVVDEFVGALPRAQVEAFVAGLVPSEADRLLAGGDEPSLRRAVELEPRRADVRVALARILLGSGRAEEARELLRPVEHDAAAAGLLARAELAADPDVPPAAREGLAALERGQYDAALSGLLAAAGATQGATRDRLRRVMVGVFEELGPNDARVADYRRRLARTLY